MALDLDNGLYVHRTDLCAIPIHEQYGEDAQRPV